MLKWSYNARSSYVSVIYPWPEFSLFPNLFYNPYLQFLNVPFLVSLVSLVFLYSYSYNEEPLVQFVAN